MQNDCPHLGRDSAGEEREAVNSQAEHRRRYEHSPQVRSDEHSNPDPIQRGKTSGENSWSKTQRTAPARSGTPSIISRVDNSTHPSLEITPNDIATATRLEALGFTSGTLEDRIAAFQQSRALPVSGLLDPHTWKTLIEAGFRLGDRLLYIRHPFMRGEDIATLQNKLGSLGFDAGRVDGIFGPETAKALKEFQRNTGLPVDGICGPTTVDELSRVFGRSETNVHSVRELELIRTQTRSLSELSVAVIHQGFLDASAELIRTTLANNGAHVQTSMHPDPSRLAALCNAQQADVCIHIEEQPGKNEIRYYQGFSYTSSSGLLLAKLISKHMKAPQCDLNVDIVGMNVPVLRETKMTAVSISIQDASFWVLHTLRTAKAIRAALEEWTSSDFRHHI